VRCRARGWLPIGKYVIGGLRRWLRMRRRWPLNRQISAVFVAAMIGNALLIILATDLWSEYATKREVAGLSPAARQAYQAVEANRIPDKPGLEALLKQTRDMESRVTIEGDLVLYGCVGIAAAITFLLGYALLGRLGRGLGSVADSARQIASGNLAARARPKGFASREEAQLTTDFNAMAASLQRAERELAEGTASIAHELRTPLTILRGRLHGIADGVFALEPKEVEGLLYQVEGLGRLVDDLQTLSLANAQRLILDVQETDIAEEVRRVMVATQPDLEAAGLEPMLDLAPAKLRGDGARLRQIVSAVLANARRYAPGSGVLRITTRQNAQFAMLEIVDHGPGLPEGSEELAFDRFWRGEASRNRNTGGSGLGLAVVRAIVEAHGGHATLTNHAGGGAAFTMRLPVKPLDIISTMG
jgi:two-component system, OmpR family, sensor histidine kinase AdeS